MLEKLTNEPIAFTIYLTQETKGLQLLDQIFTDLSNPKSIKYGKFLTKEEVDKIVTSSKESFNIVHKWLENHKITYVDTSDSIIVKTTADKAMKLFSTDFHKYQQRSSG